MREEGAKNEEDLRGKGQHNSIWWQTRWQEDLRNRARERERERERHSPWWAVDAEAPDGNIRVLQVDAVGEQGLNVLVVLRLEFGGRREVVEILLYQVCHKLLIERQLVVPGYNDFYLVR